jgi:hypothetical protein
VKLFQLRNNSYTVFPRCDVALKQFLPSLFQTMTTGLSDLFHNSVVVRRVDNIRMDLGEMGWGDVDLIGLAKDRNRWRALVNSVLNLRVP